MKTSNTRSIALARAQLDAKEISAVELTQEYLEVIKEQNTNINAFLEVYDDAIAHARIADERIQNGTASVLTGIPIALKDNIVYSGHRVSAGSKMLEQYIAPYSATVVNALISDGAVLLGRTNMDEFALGSSTENSAFGVTHNPYDTTRVPGGTSGGSAAAVAAGMCVAALGSDTGGSVRQPASFCGVVGLKPTYGTVSRYGLIAAASSLDQIGTLSQTVADARLLYGVITGHDVHDSTSLPNGFYTDNRTVKKIGVPRAFLEKGVDPDVLAQFNASLDALKQSGIEIIDIDIPALAHSLAAYYIINPAEVSSNLSRFDGIRYGFSHDADTVRGIYEESRGMGFGKEARRRIMIGAYVLSSGYVDAYYRKALSVRDMIRDQMVEAFKDIDCIATPTAPTPAYVIGEKEDPLAMYAGDIFTVPVNLTGVPALSVPMGTVTRSSSQLPVGIQFITPHGTEDALLSLGEKFEQVRS